MARLSYAKFVVFLVFVFGCDVTSSQSLIPFAGKITIAYNETIECDSEFMCVENKCDEGKWCIRLDDRWVQYALITCDQTTKESYCNHGICSEVPLPRCELSSSEFICPMIDGVYPDPSSCRRYHRCVKGVRRTNICPANNIYDHQKGECTYQRYVKDCVLFRCTGQDGQPIVYPLDNRIYGRCFSGKAYIIGRCQEHERYNLFTQKCERYCRSASTQPPDSGNCGKYVLCAEVAPYKYQQVEMSCGCDQGYDENEKRCVLNAPCVKDTPEIWCTPRKNEIESNDWSDNGNDNGDFEKTVNQTIETIEITKIIETTETTKITETATETITETPTTVVNNVKNSNSSDKGNRQSKNSKSKNVRRSTLNEHPNQQNNNNSDANIVLSILVNDNSNDNNNNIEYDGNDDIDGNLVKADNDNNDNNDNNDENPEIKQRENFVKHIFNWMIRIIIGQANSFK